MEESRVAFVVAFVDALILDAVVAIVVVDGLLVVVTAAAAAVDEVTSTVLVIKSLIVLAVDDALVAVDDATSSTSTVLGDDGEIVDVIFSLFVSTVDILEEDAVVALVVSSAAVLANEVDSVKLD